MGRLTVLGRGVWPTGAADLMRWAEENTSPVAYDVETVGLDFNDPACRLRMIQLGDREQAWVAWPEQRALLSQVLRSLLHPLAHNGLFDALWLNQRLGIPMVEVMARTVDTQTLAHLLDPRKTYNIGEEIDPEVAAWSTPPGLGLKEIAVAAFGDGADEARRALYEAFDVPTTNGKLFADAWAAIPDEAPELLRYAADDTILTAKVHDWLWARLNEYERNDLEPIERAVTAHAYRICERGMAVDVDAAATVRDILLDERATLDDELGLNADSPKQVREALLAAGLRLTQRTKSGLESVDRVVLEGLEFRGSALATSIRRARQSRKYANAYADKLARSGGRVHPFVRVTGTATGRWSIADPPIQQWPKQPLATTRHRLSMRSLMQADPGKVLVSVDLSSIEVVVAAAVTEDPNLLAAVSGELEDKLRIYEDLAEQLGVERKLAKTLVLGGQYGAGPAKLAVMLGTDDYYAVKKLRAQTFGGYWCDDPTCTRPSYSRESCADHGVWADGFYAGPRQFRREVETAWNEGWTGELRASWPGLRNPYGRWVPARLDPDSRTKVRPNWFPIFNHVVQGTSRDLLMRMLIDAGNAGLEPWLTVHDEVIVQVDRADAADARRALLELMQSRKHPVFGVPIRAEADEPSLRWSGHRPIEEA